MSQRPIIYAAFANDFDEHLPLLNRESKVINRALRGLHDKQMIEVMREESAEIEDIFDIFNAYGERIVIFQCRARGWLSSSPPRSRRNAKGLAELIGSIPNLQLVFLNGCSTLEQVQLLHEAGVKAVIATSVPIGDQMAMEFAQQFYQTLANQHTIQRAFDRATSFIKTKYEDQKSPIMHRSLELDEVATDGENLPWGLYGNTEVDAALEWKITQQAPTAPTPATGPFEVNSFLTTVVYEMAKYNEELAPQLNNVKKQILKDHLVKNLPWVIGAQLRRLLVNKKPYNEPGMVRLRQLVYTYVTITRFLSYVVLSQLWDTVRDREIDLDRAHMNQLLSLSKETYHGYDYVNLFQYLSQGLISNGVDFFVEELKVLSEELVQKAGTNEGIPGAQIFMETLRKRINDKEVGEEESRQLCVEGERQLKVVLDRLAFLAKYKVVTIKDIMVYNPKNHSPMYRHFMGELNVSHNDFLSFDTYELNNLGESHSVLLAVMNEERKFERFLNLAPFILDSNAHTEDTAPNIYLYLYREKELYYFVPSDMDINHEEGLQEVCLSTSEGGSSYELLHQQFQMFSQDIG